QLIGPPSLWSAMNAAPLIAIDAPLEARARYLAQAYKDILADKADLMQKLDILRKFRGHAVVDEWAALCASGDDVALCRALAQDHYDPAYDTSARDKAQRVAARVTAADLTLDALDQTSERIQSVLQTIAI
ncbi:MAG: tRNA 2-selenouridine(34) synthase MnmH, partial [Pseudomonadota bacterium]